MKVLGIIAEYNPFHNGHLYHLRKSVNITGASHVMAIMSGNFLQRGEAALINKWARAEMAVRSGIDLVIELPFVYSCRSAEAFAHGAVSILDKCGAVDCICFGSETGNLDRLSYIAEVLSNEPEEFRSLLKAHLDKGLSFPAARAKALEGCLSDNGFNVGKLLSNPNNVLSLEYLKALKSFGSSIKPYTIKRIAAHYNDTAIKSPIASATAIRKHILGTGQLAQSVESAIPNTTRDILEKEFSIGRGPVTDKAFSSLIVSQIRRASAQELSSVPDVAEGLEFAIIDAARKKATTQEMLRLVKSKRYTLTRLKRILVYILLDINSELFSKTVDEGYPGYARVLAFNRKGRQILRRMASSACIPVITKMARHNIPEGFLTHRMLEKDVLATDLYVLGYPNHRAAFAGQDYVTSPVYLP
ncbi:MAG: nucleotidyltransferase [Bacillota bacterium]|nr:nucleotidyltransferase [Bacillota bacterium]